MRKLHLTPVSILLTFILGACNYPFPVQLMPLSPPQVTADAPTPYQPFGEVVIPKPSTTPLPTRTPKPTDTPIPTSTLPPTSCIRRIKA